MKIISFILFFELLAISGGGGSIPPDKVIEVPVKKQKQKNYKSPNGIPYPVKWGAPPSIQTMDIRELPKDYGMGSSTLFHWITKNLEK